MSGSAAIVPKSIFTMIGIVAALLWLAAPVRGNNDNIRFVEKANLALRRTAHHLLIANGDSTSAIPPVKQIDPNTFSIEIKNSFHYEKLPVLLQESLQMQEIGRGYHVSVINCESGELQLGYHFLDLQKEGGVPCENREHENGCVIVQVSFMPEKAETPAAQPHWWMVPVGTVLAGLGFIVWRRGKTERTLVPVVQTTSINIGNSTFDFQNQTLIAAGTHHQLTYREAKLLSLLVKHANQVLERDFILKSVWEDEGITVGRSVDVFVSRLRKMLSADDRIKISAIHGVGYRLEIL